MAITPRNLMNTVFGSKTAKLCWGLGGILLVSISLIGWIGDTADEAAKKDQPNDVKLGITRPTDVEGEKQGIQKAGDVNFVAFVPATPTPPPAPTPASPEKKPPLTLRNFTSSSRNPTPVEAPQNIVVTVPPLITDYVGNNGEDVEVEPMPTIFLHRGEFIPCKLIITLDSSSLRTPVVAMVLQNIYNKKNELILAAGTEIHALCGKQSRDRIEVDGKFRAVLEDGRELEFSGIALDKKDGVKADGTKTWNITDGSAGILGTIIEPKNGEIQLLIAALVQGFSQGTQDRQTNAFGTTTVVGSLKNGGLQAASNLADYEGQRILEKLKASESFVRVPAGTDFYIYTTSIIAPEEASFGGVTQREMELRKAATERTTRQVSPTYASIPLPPPSPSAPDPERAAAMRNAATQWRMESERIRQTLEENK